MSTIEQDHDQLKLLAIFATVVEQRSFAAAARQLNTSRSRVSEQVSKLEAKLATRLLQRTTRQLNLTVEGEQVYRHAKKLRDVLSQVEECVTSDEPRGRVSITLNHDIAHKFVLPKLPEFYRRHPQIKLDLLLEDEPQDLVLEHIDLAIRIGKPKDSTMVGRTLYQDAFAIFASPDFVEQHGIETLSDLQRAPWISLSQLTEVNKVALFAGGKSLEFSPTDVQRCNSPFMVQKMVVAGLGASLLLPSTVAEEVAQGRLVRLFEQVHSDTLAFSLMYPSRKQIAKRTEAVINFFVEEQVF